MRVLIIGAGAIGIAVGASLESQNADVDFLARGATLDAIRTNCVGRTGLFGD